MATNFGNTYMEGSIEPSVRPQAPVQDNSGAVLANALAPAAGQLGAMIGSIFKGQQEDAGNKILVDYEMELLDLGDAVTQGSMDKTEASMHARNLRRKYLGLAPALRDDFDGVWSKFAGANGLGHVTITGTDEEQRIIARDNAAAALGYTPQEYSLFESRLRQATEINYQLDLLKKNGETITETQRLQGLQAVVGMSQAAYPNAQRRINEAMAAIQADPSQKATIMAQINQVIGQGIAEVEHLSGSADGSYITTPMKSALDTFNKWANGEVELGAMENELKSVKLQYDLMYATDPTLGPAIAASRIIGELGMAESTLFNQIFTPQTIARLGEIANPNAKVNFLTGEKDITNVVEGTKTAAARIAADDVEGNKQIMDVVNKAVDSVYLNERGANSPTAYKEVVELLADPAVKAVIDRNGGIGSQYNKQFAAVLSQAYDNELLAAAASFLRDTDVTDLESIRFTETGSTAEVLTGPVSDFIEPRWNGNAVEFIPKAGYETNPNVIRLANETTTGSGSVGDPLNQLIQAHANVAGMEPKQVWEQQFANRLFGQDAAPTPEQLNLGTEPSEGEVDEVSSLVNEAVVNPDQITALASVPQSTANAAVAAIQSNFDLNDFNETPIDITENVLAYANTNFNPASIVPDDQGSFDVIGTLRGTGNNSSHTHSHSHGEIDVKFGSGVDNRVDRKVVDTWAKVQEAFGKQLTIVSGFRDPARNAAAGGAKLSQHMHGNAIDIETGHLSHTERLKLIELASQMGFTGVGVYNNNLHFDMGGRRAWGPNYRGNSVPSWASATINRHLRG